MAESLGQATVDLIANTGGFEAGMDRAARKMQSVAKEAAYQGNQLEKLVGQIDPVTGALNRLDKQQQQLDAHFKAGRLPIEDYRKFTDILNAQKVATDATVTGFGKLDRQMAANGQTLKQYQSNLRNVPAQFTDIFVSLQGGQAPLTVLLQQGGQLKDMFGGVGAASKALGGYVLGLVNPISLVAAAVAATGVAYYQGSKEATAYNTALINTGNFAGTSADTLAGMASRIAETNGTVGQAAALLAQLAASGKIAVGSFELITSTAIATEKATGQAASEIVANFVKIAEDPLKATLKLNETMNYLTETVYSQIKAFEDSGNVQAAAALAQDEYAKAEQARSEGIIENLGYVESAWKIVSKAASDAWDSFLNVGRDIPLQDQIKKAQELVDTLARAKAEDPFALEGANSYREEQAQKELTDLVTQYDERQKSEAAARLSAQQKKDALDAAQYLDKVNADLSDKQSQRDKARAAYNLNVEKLRAGVAGGTVLATDPRLDAERIAKALDAIDAKYKEKKAARAKAYVEDAGTKELDQARQVYAALQAQSLAIGTQEGTTRKIGAAAQELAKWEQQIADIKTKGTLTAAQKSLLADEAAITAQKQQNAALEAQNVQRERAAASAQKLLSLEQQLNDELQNVQSGFDQQMAGIGLGDEARKRLQDDLKIRQDYQSKLEKLDRDYRKIQNPSEADTKAYEEQNATIKAALGRRLDIQQDYYAAEDAAQASWSTGALQALNTYMESANDIAAQSRTLVANSLSQLEDAFVKLATDGKLSFKSLADSIIADLARIAAKALIIQPLLASLTSGGGGVLSGVLGSADGSSGSGGLGLFDTASKAYGVATSGFGSAVSAGWSAGEGFLGGMQSAISGGYNYLSSGLSGLFGGGAASSLAGGAGSNVGYGLGQSLVSGNIGSSTTATSAAGSTGGGWLSGLSSAALPAAAAFAALKAYEAYRNGTRLDPKDTRGNAAAWATGFQPIAELNGAVSKLTEKLGIGGALGNLLNIPSTLTAMVGSALFGGSWQTEDVGLSLAVEDGDFEGRQYEYQKKKGGLFSSSKKRTRYSALDPEMQAALDATYDATEGSVLDLFDRLNVELNDGVLDGLNIGAQKISTKDKTAEEIQAEIAKWFGSVADSMVSAVDAATAAGLGGYNFEGLTAFVQNLEGVNEVVRYLNVGMYDMSVAGGKLAEQLTAIAGGLDVLQSNAATYYGAFISESERMDDTLDAVTRAFVAANQTLPETRTGFRDMVESIDTTTQVGMGMFATLMALSGQAATYYDILEQRANAAAVAAAQSANDSVNAAFAAIQRAVAAQQKAISKSLADANSRISDLTGISNALGSALKQLRGTGDDAVRMLRSQAQATLTSALAIARAGGSLVGFAGLTDALDVLGSNNTDLYGSLEEFNRDQARTANQVAELNKLNGKQLTAAEKNAEAMQAQLDALDAQLEFAQAQVDALNGIDNSVKSVAEAVKAMNASVVAALQVQPKGAAQANTPQNNRTIIDTIYSEVLGRGTVGDEAGAAFWANALQSGTATYQDVAASVAKAAIGNSAESLASKQAALEYLNKNGLPAYASGGLITGPGTGTSDSIIARLSNGEYVMSADAVRMFGTDLLDQMNAGMRPAFTEGEFGPELSLPNSGASVYTAQDTARMLNKSGSSDPQAASDMRDQARKNDQRWTQLLRYTQYLEQGFINGFPTVAEG